MGGASWCQLAARPRKKRYRPKATMTTMARTRSSMVDPFFAEARPLHDGRYPGPLQHCTLEPKNMQSVSRKDGTVFA
jgi:hypothetical protein